MRLQDTIVAISTPPGRSGLGIVRLSGDQACRIAESILRFPRGPRWQSWHAQMAELVDEDGRLVDQVVVTYFQKPKSYTAEDVVEISCHGSLVVLDYCVRRAISAGARLAEPGEFTLRAFLNGRIDLPQAEAIRDLIEATTLYQAKVAAQQAAGGLSRRLKPLKDSLVDLVALVEANIDFPDEEVPLVSDEEIVARLDPIQQELARLTESYRFGRLVREGASLAIVGKPNVGKSSLFNRLLGQDRAIVTEIPGTTRDMISETIQLGGIPIRLMDTAGVRSSADRVEQLGIERTYAAMAEADLTLVVLDLSRPLEEYDYWLIERAAQSGRVILVGNKCDLPCRAELDHPVLRVSALTGEGIDELKQRALDLLAPGHLQELQTSFVTNLRHHQCLSRALQAVEQARTAAETHVSHEILLVHLYAALRALDEVTGATTVEDILDRIFASFCIGK